MWFKQVVDNKCCKRLFALILITLTVFTSVLSPVEEVYVQAERSTNSNFREWKQIGETWSPLAYSGRNVGQHIGIGADGSFHKHGCFVVSVAIQAARAEVDDREGFDPLMLAKSIQGVNGFSGIGLQRDSIRRIYGDDFYGVSPVFDGDSVSFVPGGGWEFPAMSHEELHDMIIRFSYEEDLFIILRGMTRYGTHFFAIDYVEDGEIYINDPASNHITLRDATNSYMSPTGYNNILLLKSNVKGFNETLPGAQQPGDNSTRPDEETIGRIVNAWDEKHIPGLPGPYDATWEDDMLPPGFIPEEVHIQGIADWHSDVRLYHLEQRTTTMRMVFVFIGFGLIMYACILLITGILARTFSFDLVRYATFKRYRYNPLDEQDPKSLQFSQVLSMSFNIIVLGVFILNGTLFKIVLMILYWVLIILETVGIA